MTSTNTIQSRWRIGDHVMIFVMEVETCLILLNKRRLKSWELGGTSQCMISAWLPVLTAAVAAQLTSRVVVYTTVQHFCWRTKHGNTVLQFPLKTTRHNMLMVWKGRAAYRTVAGGGGDWGLTLNNFYPTLIACSLREKCWNLQTFLGGCGIGRLLGLSN